MAQAGCVPDEVLERRSLSGRVKTSHRHEQQIQPESCQGERRGRDEPTLTARTEEASRTDQEHEQREHHDHRAVERANEDDGMRRVFVPGGKNCRAKHK